jgi:hypothetical protein
MMATPCFTEAYPPLIRSSVLVICNRVGTAAVRTPALVVLGLLPRRNERDARRCGLRVSRSTAGHAARTGQLPAS